jgi:hypothetical protein
MYDQTGRPISSGSHPQFHCEVTASGLKWAPFSWDRIFGFVPLATTDRIREARRAALESAGGVRLKSRPERVMRTVLKSTQRPTLSSTLRGQIARAQRCT